MVRIHRDNDFSKMSIHETNQRVNMKPINDEKLNRLMFL
jgi:hypothetical protein